MSCTKFSHGSSLSCLVGAFLFFMNVVTAVHAQTTGAGSITGVVTDPTGAVVPNVQITAKHLTTGVRRSTTSNSSGNCELSALQVGQYEVTASYSGFKSFVQKGVVVNADTTLALDIALQIGSSTQTVTVEAAPAVLSTQAGDISTLVAGTQVQELALNGRNFTQFLTLGTGVNSQQVGRRMGVGQEGNPLMSVNGGRINSTQYTYDGILAMDTGGNRGLNLFPPMDAMQEIQIHKSNYTADTGSYGYGQVNVVTKAGGREYHGDVYEIFGNDALDSRNFFLAAVSPFRQNIFGFTVGGPMVPNTHSRWHDKAFFFWSEGWNRRRGPQLVSFTSPPTGAFTAITPDARMRNGDFGELSMPITDPSTGKPFFNNQIKSGIDPNAKILLNTYYPLPNRPGSPNWAASTNSTTNWREELTRVDLHFTEKTSLMVRYALDHWSVNESVLAPGPSPFTTIPGFFSKPGQNLVAQLTNLLSPVTINQFTVGFSMNRITELPTSQSTRPSGLNIPTLFESNVKNVIPGIALAGFDSIGVGSPLINVNPVFSFREDITHQTGTHSLKFGILAYRIDKFVKTVINGQQGSFNFNGSVTGNSVADFLLGRAFSYTEQSPVPIHYLFADDYEMYVQDDWKVRPNLTLNIGLRNNVFATSPNGYEKYNHISNFLPSLYDPTRAPTVLPNGRLVPGTGDPLNGIITPLAHPASINVPISLRQTRPWNLGPRFGFAWTPRRASKTVLRGGYGIFYHWDNSNQESLAENPPFSQGVTIFGTTLSNPTQGTRALLPANLQAFDYHYLYPMVQQWSLSVERDLGLGTVLSVAYVGNHAVHLDQTININQPRPGAAATKNTNTVRPYLGYGNINFDERSASANYNSLQVDARRRFTRGLAFEAAYTWSKAMAIQAGQDKLLQKNERGLADLDRTHVLTFNYVWEFPFFKDRTGLEGKVLDGWEVSGITTFQSGLPTTVTVPGDRAQVGIAGGQRADLVGPLVIHPGNGDNYFTTSAFARPPLGQFGDEGRNVLRGPGITNFDFNIRKNTPIRVKQDRQVNLQFGAEFFNVFNHPNFEGVGTGFGTLSFGRLTSALDPRNIDFRVRITF